MAKTIGQLTQATTLAGGDEFIIEQSGLTKRVAASVVRGGLVNADIDAAADIAGSKLADDAITTAKIDDDAVTTAKIDDDAVTTAKILDANVTPAKLSQPLTLETAQATTSGTSIDFTGIPSWVKRITVMLNGVSTNGTSNLIVQLGTSGGLQTSSYGGSVFVSQAGIASVGAMSSGFLIDATTLAADSRSGTIVVALVGGNVWSATGNVGLTNATRFSSLAGTILLSATLDRVRLTTVNGTDTFDAGSVNIMYEG
jgi:hypothetical protein